MVCKKAGRAFIEDLVKPDGAQVEMPCNEPGWGFVGPPFVILDRPENNRRVDSQGGDVADPPPPLHRTR